MDFDPDFEGVDFEDVLLPIVTAIVEEEEEESQAKQACRTGVLGKLYIEEPLNCGHEVRIYEVSITHSTLHRLVVLGSHYEARI